MAYKESKTERRHAFWKLVRALLQDWQSIQPTDGGWDWVTIRYKGRVYTFDLKYQNITRVGRGAMGLSRLEAAILYALAKKMIRYNQMMFQSIQARKKTRATKKDTGDAQLKLDV